jgi:methylglutaconyl-CoA hydratase
MTPPLVLYEVRPPVAVLTLNRGDKRNAISRDLVTALMEAFQTAREDAAVRAVILTGAGTVFSSGMDLSELAERLDGTSGGDVWADAQRLGQLYDLIYTLPKPTIAAVNGTAVAGGAGLVTVCDLAVSTPEARFGYPEVRRGLVAALVMPHLLRLVGERQARFLLLTGELITAAEALRTGLINAVEPAAWLLEHATSWGEALAEGGPQALASTKKLLHSFSHQSLSLEQTAQASAAPRLSEECRQGLSAFFEKRPAPWVAE